MARAHIKIRRPMHEAPKLLHYAPIRVAEVLAAAVVYQRRDIVRSAALHEDGEAGILVDLSISKVPETNMLRDV